MDDDERKRTILLINPWCQRTLITLLLMLQWSALAAEETTAQKQDPLLENKAVEIIKGMQELRLDPRQAGIYYVPPAEAEKRGFVFDDIPRDAVSPNHAALTEQRMKKQGKFVKFNSRQITYSFMETEDQSLRLNMFPGKGAVMLNWTYTVEPGKWWPFE